MATADIFRVLAGALGTGAQVPLQMDEEERKRLRRLEEIRATKQKSALEEQLIRSQINKNLRSGEEEDDLGLGKEGKLLKILSTLQSNKQRQETPIGPIQTPEALLQQHLEAFSKRKLSLGQRSGFKTIEQVREAVIEGTISEDEGVKILQDEFGFE